MINPEEIFSKLIGLAIILFFLLWVIANIKKQTIIQLLISFKEFVSEKTKVEVGNRFEGGINEFRK